MRIVNGAIGTRSPKVLVRELGTVGKWRTNRDHPHFSIVKIGQNTEKGPGDLWSLAIAQTPEKDHLPRMM